MANTVKKAAPNLPSARVGAGSYRAALLLALCIILPLTLLLLENASAFNTRLVFSSDSQVNTPMVYLDDIVASYNGNELLKRKAQGVIVASAPFPGKVKLIKKPQIVRALKRYKLTTNSTDIFIPEEIKVTRKAKTFNIKDIESIIRAELTKRNFIDNKKTLFTLSDIQKEVVLPAKQVKTIVKVPGKIRGRNKFWVSFYIDGKLKSRVWATGNIKRNLEVLAVNKNLRVNDIVKEEDLVYVKKNILELNGGYITNKRAVIGKKATRNLREGSLFRKDVIGQPPTVKAGDLVSIQVNMKNLIINTDGKVLSPEGHIGDEVTVLNINSKEKIKAVVLNNRTVKVEVR